MLQYQVNFRGEGWQPVDVAIVLVDGRLAWWRSGDKGIAPSPYWMLTEETRRNPTFRSACWDALSDEEKSHSINRRKPKVKELMAA